MKNVATARSFDVLTVVHARDKDVRVNITRVPIVVPNADAEKYVKQAEEAGVALAVTDAPDNARSTELETFPSNVDPFEATGVVNPDGSPVTPPVDLSEGVAAQTGQGDPVPPLPEHNDTGDGIPAADTDTQEA